MIIFEKTRNMLKTIAIITCCAFSFVNFAQESSTHCSKRSHKITSNLKSNSLSIAQIAETERYDVHFYSLDLEMNNLVTDVVGTAEIHASAREILDSALFELFNTLTITEIRVNGSPVTYSRVNSAIKVPVNAILNENFIISIDYGGTPPTAATNPLGGSGMTNASSPSWGNQVTWSLSEPFSAYEWWPCKQSLTDKADSCSIKVTVPSSCMAGSNGTLENVVDLGATKRYEWMHRHPIDYYLISVAVAQYVDYSIYANPAGSAGPVLIQNFIYNNPATLTNFQADIDETVDFIELFADLYGPYPFDDEKYGHCMAPLSGGMEHQTMTTQGWFEKGLTSHELGHQWWGDNVTCGSWADIWVNEGFASYSEYLMLENLYPSSVTSHMNDVHNNVKSQPTGSVWVEDSLNEGRIFSGRLTYDKGAAIIHSMRYMVNNDAQFFQGLKNIQTNFADGTALGLDIKSEMEAVSGVDLTEFFEQWYFGSGYPTYSAEWNLMNDIVFVQINQTTSDPSVTPFFTNPIDIRITRTGMSDTIVRIPVNGSSSIVALEGIANIQNITHLDYGNWIINNQGTITMNSALSIEENNALNEIVVYPNPTEGYLSINVDNLEHYTVSVINSKGQTVIQKDCNGNETIDIRNQPAGQYLINIHSSDGNQTIRRIIRR